MAIVKGIVTLGAGIGEVKPDDMDSHKGDAHCDVDITLHRPKLCLSGKKIY
jgi:hypothetical protein